MIDTKQPVSVKVRPEDGPPMVETTPDERVTVSCIEKGRFTRGVGGVCIFAVMVVILVLADMLVGRKTSVSTKGVYASFMQVL